MKKTRDIVRLSAGSAQFGIMVIAHNGRPCLDKPVDVSWAIEYVRSLSKSHFHVLVPIDQKMGMPAIRSAQYTAPYDLLVIVGHGNLLGEVEMGDPAADITPDGLRSIALRTTLDPYVVFIDACQAGNIFRLRAGLHGLPLAFEDALATISASWKLVTIDEGAWRKKDARNSPSCFFLDTLLRGMTDARLTTGQAFKQACDALRQGSNQLRSQADMPIADIRESAG